MKRTTRCERFEDHGNRCGIGLAAGLAIGGGLLGAMSGSQEKEKKTSSEVSWNEDQRKYLFGDAWTPNLPQYTSGALNYASALAGGYNPATGPQQLQSFNDLIGGGSGQNQYNAQNPWYLDPNTGTSAYTPYAGVSGLLGYGAGSTPPLLTSSPYFGNNVADPEGLKTYPGMEGFMQTGTKDGTSGEDGKNKVQSASLKYNPGNGLLWGVQVGDNILSMDAADTLRKAGLIDLGDDEKGWDVAAAMQGFRNAMNYG